MLLFSQGIWAEYTKHSLINSPSGNGLLFFAILWEITKLVLNVLSLHVQSLVKRACFFHWRKAPPRYSNNGQKSVGIYRKKQVT